MEEVYLHRMEEYLRNCVEEGEIAGANFLLYRQGVEEAYFETGFADLEAGKPIRRDTIFSLYSMSKPVTAAAVMKLFEMGKIDLQDPVSQYLPGFHSQRVEEGERDVPVHRECTLHDLLSMTSGLPYNGMESRPAREADVVFQELEDRAMGENPMTTQEFANRVGSCALSFHPGEHWMYGTSADVLGAVVEVASGKRFGEFLREYFFEPLHMQDTGFYVPAEKQERLSKVYTKTPEGLRRYDGHHLGIFREKIEAPAFESGGAGLFTTIDDYMRFGRMLLQKGELEGERILSSKTVKYMTSCGLTQAQQADFDLWPGLSGYTYGNLMRVLRDPGLAILNGSRGEYGWDGWLGPYFLNSPQDAMTFLFMYQKSDSGVTPMTRRLKNMLFAGM